MILTREKILEQRLPTKKVDVPWLEDTQIIVRALPAYIIEKSQIMEAGANLDGFVFVNAVIDESGKRIYKDEEADLIADSVDSALIQLVVRAAFSLSDIPDDRKEAIKKNWPIRAIDSSGG